MYEHMEIESAPSSLSDLVRDQMRHDGQFVPEVKWLLSDFDTWERNPHYINRKLWLVDDSHPEDDAPRTVRLVVVQCNAYRIPRCVVVDDSDIPF